jgi:hypothetical protein
MQLEVLKRSCGMQLCPGYTKRQNNAASTWAVKWQTPTALTHCEAVHYSHAVRAVVYPASERQQQSKPGSDAAVAWLVEFVQTLDIME